MKRIKPPHWAMLEIAQQETPRNTIDLWSRVEAKLTAPADKALGTMIRSRKEQIAFGLALVLLIGSLFFVPAARAYAEDIIQRMGIAFVNTQQFDENVRVEEAGMIKVTPPPSLSVDEVRAQIGFPLLLPDWLPEDLIYVHRSISAYDPQSWEGSGKKVSISYSRTEQFNTASGMLILMANDGPISAPPLLAESREQLVTVNGQPGIYVHGGWQDDGSGDPNTKMGILQWDDQADDAYLTWNQGGVTYLLAAHNLGADLDMLLRIAESMKSK